MSDSVAPVRRGGGFNVDTILARPTAALTPRVSHPAVDAIFDPERDAKLTIPYAEQGDPAMYEPANVRARAELRSNPGIQDSLKRLSMALPWTGGKLSRDAYMRFHAKLVEILIPTATEEQVESIRARDWSMDSCGADHLTYDNFCKSMFELADQWTTTVEPAEYLAFLNTLKYRLVRMLD